MGSDRSVLIADRLLLFHGGGDRPLWSPESPVSHPATAGEEALPYTVVCAPWPMRVALHPCCILTGVGLLTSPCGQSSSMEDERLETLGSSPGSPVSLPAAAGKKILPQFEHRCRRMVHGTPKAHSGQSCSFHDEHLETQDSSFREPMLHPVASAELRC